MTSSQDAYEMTLGRRDAMNGVPFCEYWSEPRKLSYCNRIAWEVARDLTSRPVKRVGTVGDQPSAVSSLGSAA